MGRHGTISARPDILHCEHVLNVDSRQGILEKLEKILKFKNQQDPLVNFQKSQGDPKDD